MAIPLQITTARRAAPRAARFSARDLPPGTRVLNPGDRGYAGSRGPKGPDDAIGHEDAKSWASRAKMRNHLDELNDDVTRAGRNVGRLNYGVAGLTAGLGVTGGAAAYVSGRRQAKRVRKVWEPSMPFVRRATKVRGAYDITSLPKRPTREQRLADWASNDVNALKLTGGSIAVGGGAALGGAYAGNRKVASARAERRRSRQLVPVDKRGPRPSVLKEHFGSPRKAATTLARNPEHLAAGGVLGAGVGAQARPLERRRTKEQRERMDRVSAGVVGGAAAQGAWLGTGYTVRHLGHKTERKRPPGMSRSAHTKLMRDHHKATGVPTNTKPDRAHAPTFYRTYPEGLPATKYKRALGHMSGGRGALLQGALIGAGAAGAASAVGRRQRDISKALYQREERVSPLRVAGLTAGGLLTAYGFAHSGMVGRAIGRGIKMAARDGNQHAVEALSRAQAARGAIRVGMAPGEASLRRIGAVNDAINRVPRSIRPEVAAAAGLILTSRSAPVSRTHYRQVSTPVRGYGRAW